MSLIKKIDVPKHFAARRAMRLPATHAISPGGIGISRIEGGGAKANSAKRIEGVSTEHPSSGVVPAKD
jgi:hypothetical protein